MTQPDGHPLPPVHQRMLVKTRMQLDANFRSRSKSNRLTRIQHSKSKIAEKEQMLSSKDTHRQKHPKHLSHPKLKQEVATPNMDPDNRGGLQKESPTTTTNKTPTFSPKQHQPPLLLNPHHQHTTTTPPPPLHITTTTTPCNTMVQQA